MSKKPKKNIQEIAQKEYPDFTDAVARLSVAELEKRLVEYAKETENVQTELEENKTISELKDKLAEAKGPYNDTKKALRIKMRYLMSLVKEKGGT